MVLPLYDIPDKHLLFIFLVAFLNENKIAYSLVLAKLALCEPVLCDEALGPHVDDELGAHSLFALHFHRAAHLLDDLLADGETQPRPLLVPRGILVKLAEVDKQLFAALFWHTHTCVDDAQLDAHEVLLTFNIVRLV